LTVGHITVEGKKPLVFLRPRMFGGAMARIASDVTHAVGGTPMVLLLRVCAGCP
jgi:hypothetical protein